MSKGLFYVMCFMPASVMLVVLMLFLWGCADTVLQDHLKYGVGPRPIECDASLEGC